MAAWSSTQPRPTWWWLLPILSSKKAAIETMTYFQAGHRTLHPPHPTKSWEYGVRVGPAGEQTVLYVPNSSAILTRAVLYWKVRAGGDGLGGINQICIRTQKVSLQKVALLQGSRDPWSCAWTQQQAGRAGAINRPVAPSPGLQIPGEGVIPSLDSSTGDLEKWQHLSLPLPYMLLKKYLFLKENLKHSQK